MENKLHQTSTYKHYLPASITMPENKKTSILLIGAGGNGSPMLTGIARINHAIVNMGKHPGIALTVMDHDHVTAANVGRQLFSPSDIGRNKAECLVTRINNFFGLKFRALPFMFARSHIDQIKQHRIDMIITAVDNYEARETASLAAKASGAYWLDMGNTANTGQCILGTGQAVKQPTRVKQPCMPHLPTVIDLCPDLKNHAADSGQGPTCSASISDALDKQDLFINTALSTYALSILWDAFRHGCLSHHGVFINLETKRSSPLQVNPQVWKQMGWDPLRDTQRAKATKKPTATTKARAA